MSRLDKISITFILGIWLAVLSVGLVSRIPMIGDEVTHYYMLVTQAEGLPTPCFEAQIPLAMDGADKDTKYYTHVALWHYLGAILFRLTGSIAVVQIYHSLFLLQLLFAVLAIAGRIGCGIEEGRLLAILAVASLPMTLIFSVAFYQDVPAVAQVLTAFWLLMSGRWLLAACFISVALGIKENMILFLPAYFIALITSVCKNTMWRRVMAIVTTLAILLASCSYASYVLTKYGHGHYYPYQVLKIKVSNILMKLPEVSERLSADAVPANPTKPAPRVPATLYSPKVICNHPGDLRIKKNWFIYGGGVLWLCLAFGLAGLFVRKKELEASKVDAWQSFLLLLAGGACIVLTRLLLEAQEARFLMPGVIFILVPAAVYAARIPKVRLWVWVVIIMAVVQSGAVLYKTFTLRHVSAGIMEAIDYLKREPPTPNRIFMYPEGNYRFFPCNHTWYLDYELRKFWKADNNQRLDMLHAKEIGAIVIKKHLVGVIDPKMENLGVYPDFFVRDMDTDARFKKVLDNRHVTIYRVPAIDRSTGVK